MNQLELFEKIVKIKIITDQGYQTFNLASSEVKEFILKQSEKSKLWLYVDGVNMDPVKVSKEIISSAKEIVFTLPLVGG